MMIDVSSRTLPRMPHPVLIAEDRGPVRTLRLNRPTLHNAFDAELVAVLTQALLDAAQATAIRVVVLAGAGSSFSAGADLQWMRGMIAASEADNRADALALARLLRTLDELPKPTIARVHGPAYGGGVGLVAACDIAIGSTETRFGLTESRLGLLPAVISPYVIAAIGARQARRWFATAETFDAAVAQSLGLLHQVVIGNQLDQAIDHQVRLLLTAGPLASSAAKALVARVARGGDADAVDAENASLIARLRVSPEGQEGLGAFLDKRAPAWMPEHVS